MQIRLQKHIADMGICSRRKAENLISEGKIKVNGKIIDKLGTKIDPNKDKVEVLGIKSKKDKLVYIILNKPIDYISSASNTQGKSVIELITKENNINKNKQEIKERVYPVGRLDKDSEGLMILTNDGELTNTLTHPRYEHEKEYEVTIDKPLDKKAKKVLENGMKIDETLLSGIKIKKEFNKGKKTIVTVILKEGKNRQIRKMFGRLGYKIFTLKRTRINKVKLGNLPIGKWKLIKKQDII
jgi:pseudouridine synthase